MVSMSKRKQPHLGMKNVSSKPCSEYAQRADEAKKLTKPWIKSTTQKGPKSTHFTNL